MHAFFLSAFLKSQTLPELKLRLKYSKLIFPPVDTWNENEWLDLAECTYMLTSKNHPLIFIENPHIYTWSLDITTLITKPSHEIRPPLKPWIYLPSIAFTNRLSSRSVLYLFIACQICVSNRWILISPPPICNSSILLMKMLSAFIVCMPGLCCRCVNVRKIGG